MALLTTTIGTYPKPTYVPVTNWFQKEGTSSPEPTQTHNNTYLQSRQENLVRILDLATHEVVEEQVRLGIDVPTDGELRRENYIHYHCRHLQGIDFERLTRKVMRSGTWTTAVPTISGPVRVKEHFLARDWQVAQAVTDRRINITIPGPLTIIDSLADDYYGDERKLAHEFAEVLNSEILALAAAGCRWIQVDEPLFARESEKALAYGIENLERCFYNVPQDVTRVTHICCGYPNRIDNEDYSKASPEEYFRLATPLDEADIDAVSIEDAHCHNDLGLLEKFKNTTIIFGIIAIARSRVDPVEEILSRLRLALEHIDGNRLIAAPDCGLGMLDRETAVEKLKNMVQAAKSVG